MLERCVPHGEHLVDHHDVRFEECGDGKAEPHAHPGGVVLHLAVDGVGEFGELDDVVEALAHVRPLEAEQ
ncbi:MAG: hypothetical protein F2873_06270 [Actinobacteria bacterium]|nr:hypothetical protein [Actinomycetota bacterium]